MREDPSVVGCADSRPWRKNADVVILWDQVQDIKCSCASPVRLDFCACHIFFVLFVSDEDVLKYTSDVTYATTRGAARVCVRTSPIYEARN